MLYHMKKLQGDFHMTCLKFIMKWAEIIEMMMLKSNVKCISGHMILQVLRTCFDNFFQ